MNGRLVLACALAACALVAGCQSGTQGTPTTSPQSPTEPSFPTSRPSTSRPTAAPPTKTATPSAPVSPPAAQVLPPQNGYVFIATKSGQSRCQLDEESVACEALFTNAPMQDGVRANGVNVTADGSLSWIVGNLGDIPVVTIDYRTYSAVGWTIDATGDGTRFTNQRTKHGMFVSIEKVESF
jgi:hypothetical protein